MMTRMRMRIELRLSIWSLAVLLVALFGGDCGIIEGFTTTTTRTIHRVTSTSTSSSSVVAVLTPLYAVSTGSKPKNRVKKQGYVPKWKKKETLGGNDPNEPVEYDKIGLKGTVRVIFRQGNETKHTMAFVGQPLRDVASQAGQFIKYGCGKGECGTCEALVNGKWIRPCSTAVPVLDPVVDGNEYIVQVKDISSKTTSSGKFYSIRSFFMGFYNNLLGMIGFVKYRRAAKRNWNERQEYENLIKLRTQQKKLLRKQQQLQSQQKED